MTVTLFENPASGNCYKVRLILTLLGIEFERRELSVNDWSDREEVVGGISPTLNVPAVLLENGRALAESNAILWYFANGTEFVPEDPFEAAQVLQWMFFEQYKHEPTIAVVRYWESLADSKVPSHIDLDRKRAGGYDALQVMEDHLESRAFFVGERFSIADIALYAYTHVAPEGGFDLAAYPNIRGWMARVAEQPGHIPISA